MVTRKALVEAEVSPSVHRYCRRIFGLEIEVQRRIRVWETTAAFRVDRGTSPADILSAVLRNVRTPNTYRIRLLLDGGNQPVLEHAIVLNIESEPA